MAWVGSNLHLSRPPDQLATWNDTLAWFKFSSENESFCTIQVNSQTVFEPYPNPEKSPIANQHRRKHWNISGLYELCAYKSITAKQLFDIPQTPNIA